MYTILREIFKLSSHIVTKKTSKLHVTGLYEGNPQVTGGFPSQRTSYAENVSIWWCYHEYLSVLCTANMNHLLHGCTHLERKHNNNMSTIQWSWGITIDWHILMGASQWYHMSITASEITPATPLFVQQLVWAVYKEISKVLITSGFWGPSET